MSDERLRILKMVEEGKLSVEEANELLNTMDGVTEKEKKVKKKPRFLKILVEENGDGKVDIAIPLSLAKTALKFIPNRAKESLAEQEIDLDNLLESIEGDLNDGTLVNINDGSDHVIIKVE
ncbi:MAG: SHOCT-like domain-containing protein [Nanoarchaeota archaeon]